MFNYANKVPSDYALICAHFQNNKYESVSFCGQIRVKSQMTFLKKKY